MRDLTSLHVLGNVRFIPPAVPAHAAIFPLEVLRNTHCCILKVVAHMNPVITPLRWLLFERQF